MFKKILVCLDGSQLAEAILPYAIEQARCFDSDLVLFRAFSVPPAISLAMPGMPSLPVESKRVEKLLIEDEKEAETYLESLADKLQSEEKLKVSYESVLGAAGPVIIDYCARQEIELVTLVTHGRSGLGRAMLGSVADYVIRHSKIPILLIRPIGNKTQ